MERHIAELTNAQRRLGVLVTEVYNSGEPAGEAIRLWPRLRTDRIRPNLLRWSLFYLGAMLRRLDLSDGRMPVLHVHGDWHAFLLGRLAARRFGIRTRAATLHEWARGTDRSYALALGEYQPIFCTGGREAKRLAGITGTNVIHLPSAPADLFFAEPERAARHVDVIAVGTLNARKNYELLVECAALMPRLSFVVYGDGPERPRLQALAALKGLSNIEFAGVASAEEIRDAMCAARLFVNTALAEGFPTAALEAMACGLPVVMTPSNDYSAIVEPGVNGTITSGWNANELSQALERTLDDPGRLAKAGKTARAIAERHRWDSKARIVTEAMSAAASERGQQR
jgi:glycosyltransferase involved in cell wall biosynthesis